MALPKEGHMSFFERLSREDAKRVIGDLRKIPPEDNGVQIVCDSTNLNPFLGEVKITSQYNEDDLSTHADQLETSMARADATFITTQRPLKSSVKPKKTTFVGFKYSKELNS